MRFRPAYYFLNTLLGSSEEILFTFLIFILCKSLGAVPFQLAVMACIKPVTSMVSYYASSHLAGKPHKIRNYLAWNYLIGSLPCFLFPFIDNVWFYIASYALFMITKKAVYPAWIEVLKKHCPLQKLGYVVSLNSSVMFGIICILTPLLGFLIDADPDIWRWFFVGSAILKLACLPILWTITLEAQVLPKQPITFHRAFLKPLADGWELMKRKPGFAHYLALYFLGGAGLVGIQPILPLYFEQDLNLSYTELALAFSLCKGVAFIAASPFWSYYASKMTLYILNSIANLFSCLFLACLIVSGFGLPWLFTAYLFYGIMKAGAELSYNMSGAVFSEEEESTQYSSMNLALVGIRGVICPSLGYLVYSLSDAHHVFGIALALCFAGIPYGFWIESRYSYYSRPLQLQEG